MTSDETPITIRVTPYQVDLLRQMVALDIFDHKHGEMSTGVDRDKDPEYAARRVRASEELLALINEASNQAQQ